MNKHKKRIIELEADNKTLSHTLTSYEKAMDKLKAQLQAANLNIDLLDNHCRSLERNTNHETL